MLAATLWLAKLRRLVSPETVDASQMFPLLSAREWRDGSNDDRSYFSVAHRRRSSPVGRLRHAERRLGGDRDAGLFRVFPSFAGEVPTLSLLRGSMLTQPLLLRVSLVVSDHLQHGDGDGAVRFDRRFSQRGLELMLDEFHANC
jgi:hypothetical protein